MAICLKERAVLDRRIRENRREMEEIQEQKKLVQLAFCELNQLKIERGIKQLKLAKIDWLTFYIIFKHSIYTLEYFNIFLLFLLINIFNFFPSVVEYVKKAHLLSFV